MARALYIYVPLDLRLLEGIVDAHLESFAEELKDLFSDDELETFQRQLDEMASFSISQRSTELSFDHFETSPSEGKRNLFDRAKSSLVLEPLPFLETNPFQVSSIRSFLSRLDEVLIDDEGLGELYKKEEYLQKISELRGVEALFQAELPSPKVSPKSLFIPVEPIDFLVRDVYLEVDRILFENQLERTLLKLREEKDSLKDLFFIVRENRLTPDELFRRSGLSAKSFDDDLEKLKFFLKRIQK